MLSKDEVIGFLNENFINTWVANCELGRIPGLQEPIAKRREREGKNFDTAHPLAQAIIKGWKTGSTKGSPVDCFVISPAFELMGRQMVHNLLDDSERRGLWQYEYYLEFLKEALTGKQPGLGNIVLTSEQSSQAVLDLFRTPTVGNYQDWTVVTIDATAFENGGALIIDFEIGREEGEVGFYLFDGDTELPTTEDTPKDMLTWTWGEPGDTRQIIHRFERGQFFKLGATGHWRRDEACINAFRAKISVVADQQAESLDGAHLGSDKDTSGVVLDRARPSQEILDVFRAPGTGYQDYTVVNIDAMAFENGGTLVIDIQVGNGDTSGSFALFRNDTEPPTEGHPTEAISSVSGIRPGEAGKIKTRFVQGKVFKFGATGDWYSEKGRTNAFHAKISVEEN